MSENYAVLLPTGELLRVGHEFLHPDGVHECFIVRISPFVVTYECGFVEDIRWPDQLWPGAEIVREMEILDRAVLDAADNWLERGCHDSIYSERLADAVRARREGNG